jgi:NADPH2 dehydrogenase
MSSPDNVEVFTKLCQSIHDRFPNLGYVHMVESRGDPAKLANWATESGDAPDAETLNPFRRIFEGSSTAFLSAGGYTGDLAREVVKAHGGAVVFGRIFISSKSPPLPRPPCGRSDTFLGRRRLSISTYPAFRLLVETH